MTLHERVLMLLANKYVDDVVIAAPYSVTKDFIKSLNISKVVVPLSKEDQILEERKEEDPYAMAKELGIYHEYEIENHMTVETIAKRVFANREAYMAKYNKKKVQEDKYYEEKKGEIFEV